MPTTTAGRGTPAREPPPLRETWATLANGGNYRVEITAAGRAAIAHDALILAMQSGDERAIGRFLDHFARIARRKAEAELHARNDFRAIDAAHDVVTDLAMQLAQPGAPIPEAIGSYLGTAVRNRLRRIARKEKRDEQRIEDGMFVSRASLRALAGEPDAFADTVDCPEASPNVLAQVDRLRLYGDEWQLLLWRAEGVTATEVAGWTGVSKHAANKRTQRVINRCRATLAAGGVA
jgi:DNA-directed RNA polymerase specialized sigma24 family protein